MGMFSWDREVNLIHRQLNHYYQPGPVRYPEREKYFSRSGYIVSRNLPIGMILQLNNLYLPSEEFTSCDMVTPFGILFSNHVFFRLGISIPFGV